MKLRSPDRLMFFLNHMRPEANHPLLERSRVLTLVFTDLVDSTALRSKLGDTEAGRIISLHLDQLRALVEEGGGAEISSAGDGCFLTFETPSQAVEFALRLQAIHLTNPDWPKVRIGMHMGEVTEKTGQGGDGRAADVEGLAVDLASRIQSLALPSQVLMSYPVFDNARQRLTLESDGGEIEWRAHGRYVFKGADAALEIYEVGQKESAPFRPPTGSDKAHRDVRVEDEETLGWRPAQGLELPGRPNWVLESKIGEGGFGDVWLVRQPKTGERHVVKFCYSSEHLRTLKREVTLFRLLKETLGERTDIARVLDYQFDHAPYYLEMDYAGDYNLGQWIDKQGGAMQIPVHTRIEIVAQVAEAVAAAHSVGVLHKDIKPSNIMIADEGVAIPRIRMIDFGIGAVDNKDLLSARGITATGLTEVPASGEEGSFSGTRLYMAPELIEGRPASTKSDIYSLGVILYQLVSGDMTSTLATGWERDVPDPLLQADIAACADGRPENRLSGAELLAHRLRSLPERHRELKERHAAEHREERQRRRRRVYVLLSLLGLVALVITGVFAWQQHQVAASEQGLRQRAQGAQRDAEKQKLRAEDALREAEQTRYFANIALGEAALRESRIDKVQEILFQETPAGLQDIEWGWLLARTSPEIFSLKRLNIFDTQFSPDGNYLYCGTRGVEPKGYVHRYDAKTGGFVDLVESNQRLVWNLKVSPDGKYVATASSDNTAALLDAGNLKVIKMLKGHRGIVRDVAFSPDGKFVVTGSRDHTLRVYTVPEGRFVRSMAIEHQSLTEMTISPAGHLVVATLEGNVIMLSLDGKEVARTATHPGAVYSIAFHPDGRLFTACKDARVRLFPALAGAAGETTVTAPIAPVADIVTEGTWPSQVRVFPSGEQVAIGGDSGRVYLASPDLQSITTLAHVDQPLWKMAVSSDSTRLVTTSRWSSRMLDVNLLQAPTKKQVIPAKDEPPPAAHRLDVAAVVSLRDQAWIQDRQWRVTEGRVLATVRDVPFVVNSYFYRYSDELPRRLDLEPHTLKASLVDTQTSTIIRHYPDDLTVATAFAPQSAFAALLTNTKGVLVIDPKTGEPRRTLNRTTPEEVGSSIIATAKGTLIVGYTDGEIIEWDPVSGTELRYISPKGSAIAGSLRLSDDNSLLLACQDDNRCTVYNLQTGDTISTLSGHVRPVHSGLFTRDNKRVITCSRDGTAKLWDTKTGRELVTVINLPSPLVALGVRILPGDRGLAAVISDGTLQLHDIFPANENSYGDADAPLEAKVELWKRRQRIGPQVQLEDIAGKY